MKDDQADLGKIRLNKNPSYTRVVRKLGPYSRPPALVDVDGRTREGRMMKRVRAELVEHVGGKPSPTQRALIERVVALSLRIALMERHTFGAGVVMSEKDGREYLAWSNALERTVRRLGLASRGGAALPSLSDYAKTRGAQ